MATTPFKATNWSPNELIGEDKMDQMSANMNWLRDNTPRGLYTLPGGSKRVEGLRIASGKAIVASRKAAVADIEVRFSSFFSSGCQPSITTGIVSNATRRIFLVYRGIGQVQPDNRGFELRLTADNGTAKKEASINHTVWVAWQAMGY